MPGLIYGFTHDLLCRIRCPIHVYTNRGEGGKYNLIFHKYFDIKFILTLQDECELPFGTQSGAIGLQAFHVHGELGHVWCLDTCWCDVPEGDATCWENISQ